MVQPLVELTSSLTKKDGIYRTPHITDYGLPQAEVVSQSPRFSHAMRDEPPQLRSVVYLVQ